MELGFQGVALLLDRAQCLGDGQLQFILTALQTRLQGGDFGVFARCALRQLRLGLCLGELHGVFLLQVGGMQALVKLLLERFVAHLLQDIGIAGLVHLKRFGAMRANDVVHGMTRGSEGWTLV